MTLRRYFLLLAFLPALSFGQIHYDSGYTWRGYAGTVAPTCPSKLCHYFPMNTWDSVYKEFTAWKSVNGNPNSASAFVNFRVIFPPGYNVNDATKKYPLIVMFHGAGESGRVWNHHYNYAPTDSTYDNNAHQLKNGGNQHRMAVGKPPSNPGSFPGIVVFPQASYNGVWGDTTTTNLSDTEQMLIGFIESQLVARYHADINRIVAHGLSNGAKSLWAIAQKRPDLFAAILPMSGVPYNPNQAANILVTTPVRLFQGGLDINPTPNAAQQTINAFISKGGTPEYFLYSDLGHGTWNRAYNEPDFFTWIKARDKRKIHVFGGSTEICNNAIKLGFSANMSSYQWTKDGADIAGATGRFLDNITQPGRYALKFQRPNGQWDSSFDVNIVLSSNCNVARPVLSTNLDTTVCSRAGSGIVLDDNGQSIDAVTFNITAIQFNGLVPSAGSPVTGTGFYEVEIFDDAYTNKGITPVNVVYTVVPVSAAGYAGDPASVVLTVNPEPVLSTSLNATRCSDIASGIVLDDSGAGVAATSFDITSISFNGLVASGGAPASGVDLATGVIADDAYTNLTPATKSVVYSVVPNSAAGCAGQQVDVVFSVRPEPALSTGLDATVGSKTASGIMLDDDGTGVAASTFSIASIDFNGLVPSAGAPATGTGLPASIISDDAYTNNGAAAVDVIYTILPVSAQGCAGNAGTVVLTVSPVPALGGQLSVTRCSDVPSGVTLTDSGSGVTAATYEITAINFNGLTASAGNPSTGTGFNANVIKDDAFTNKGTAPKDVVYTIIPVSSAGHRGNPANITFTVNPEPVLKPGLTSTQCSDVASGITLDNNGTSATAAAFNITSVSSGGLTTSAGEPSTGSGLPASVIADDAFTNKGVAAVNIIYTVVPVSSNGCAGDAANVTFTVRPEPVLSNVLDAVVSSGTASGIILDNSGAGVNASAFDIISIITNGLQASAGTPATGTALGAAAISDDAYVNATTQPVNVVYTVSPVSADGCRGDSGTVTLTVDPQPVEPEDDDVPGDDPGVDPKDDDPGVDPGDNPEDDDPGVDPDDNPEDDDPGVDPVDDPGEDDSDDDGENEDDEEGEDDDNNDPVDPGEGDGGEIPAPVIDIPADTSSGTIVTDIPVRSDDYAVYPNPTKGRVMIKAASESGSGLLLMTSNGQIIILPAVRREDETVEIDLSGLSAGLYIIRYGAFIARIIKE